MTQNTSSNHDHTQAKLYLIVGICAAVMETISVINVKQVSIDSIAAYFMSIMFICMSWAIFYRVNNPKISSYIEITSKCFGIAALLLWSWFLYIKFQRN